MSETAISNIALGKVIKVPKNGVDTDFLVAKRDEQGTVLLELVCSEQKRMHSENVSNYSGCEMDLYLQDETTGYLSQFSDAVKSCIVARNITTFNYGDTDPTTISRKAFVPSRGDLDAMDPTTLEPDAANGMLRCFYEHYSTTQNANEIRKGYNSLNSAVSWWLRSPYSTTNFYYVNNNGVLNYGSASYTGSWLRAALNVANATLVVAEGDTLRLNPEGLSYYPVEFDFKIGESIARPRFVAVQYNEENLYDVKVEICNNYGDEEPVWQDATSQDQIELLNTSKETANWQIGIRCFGKSEFDGHFNEPTVKILTD